MAFKGQNVQQTSLHLKIIAGSRVGVRRVGWVCRVCRVGRWVWQSRVRQGSIGWGENLSCWCCDKWCGNCMVDYFGGKVKVYSCCTNELFQWYIYLCEHWKSMHMERYRRLAQFHNWRRRREQRVQQSIRKGYDHEWNNWLVGENVKFVKFSYQTL